MNQMLFALVCTGIIFAAGCGQQQQKASTPQSTESVEASAQGVVAQVQQVAQEGTQAVTEAGQEAQNAANQMMDQAKQMLASAQEMVANGKFEEAIAAAQKVLSFDANNMDAKNIIETAKAKIAELAQQKASEIQGDISNKLNALGN